MANHDESYEVGYGRPPQESRFQKGVSGNPKGRPRGSKNLATVVLKESRERLRVNGPHGVRTITKLEATVKQLGNKSAQGELRAAKEFLNLVKQSEESVSTDARVLPMNELDHQVLEGLRRRMAGLKAEKSK